MADSKHLSLSVTPFRFCIRGSIEVAGPCDESLIALMAVQVTCLMSKVPLTELGRAYMAKSIRDEMALKYQVIRSHTAQYLEDPTGFEGSIGSATKTKWLFSLDLKGLIGERTLSSTPSPPVVRIQEIVYPGLMSKLRDLRMEINLMLSYQTVFPKEFPESQLKGYGFVDRPSHAFLENFRKSYSMISNIDVESPEPLLPPKPHKPRPGIKNGITALFRRRSGSPGPSGQGPLALPAPPDQGAGPSGTSS
ncbi:M [Blacklegged tick rhabdovirus 1]|uniref:M n=1 Tax=Blacklegged tick rhabdovirus 1 TaxID=2079605 RepID=A0A2K9YNG6_9RHAB|nr:M [Blacklegged tick rhabdovirus-1] [Blacklegged tick rhabdovirus-1]AUW34388.1 M [Blacklegged tick rhabdovirus-1] [Blacklegged tick rhabdovirus-1]